MIDIHAHLLWAVDDGPKNISESIRLLKQAVTEGITEIIATPHSFHPKYHAQFDVITHQIQILKLQLLENNIPITLHTGHEIRLTEKIIPLYKSHHIHTLANSNYVLVELPSYSIPNFTTEIIRQILAAGLVPIIAHPERNKAIMERPVILERLIKQGAMTQVTASSLAGYFGRAIQQFTLNLVQANMAHTYGSDVHNVINRPFLFNEGLHFLEKKKQLDTIDLLLKNNRRVIQNRALLIDEPLKLEASKWWKVRSW